MSKTEIARRNIRMRLAYLDLPQSALAEALGITHQAVSSKLRGKSPLTVDNLESISKVLDLSVEDLLRENFTSSDGWGAAK